MKSAVVMPMYNENTNAFMPLHFAIGEVNKTEGASLVVVDDGSTDDTYEFTATLLDKYGRDNYHILRNKDNLGIGAAVDEGFRFAIDELGADIIARTDADTEVDIGWLGSYLGYMSLHPEVGAASGPVKFKIVGFGYEMPAGVILDMHHAQARWVNGMIRAIKQRRMNARHTVIGHNLAVRADVYAATDGFTLPDGAGNLTDDNHFSDQLTRQFGGDVIGYSHRSGVSTSMRHFQRHGIIGGLWKYMN